MWMEKTADSCNKKPPDTFQATDLVHQFFLAWAFLFSNPRPVIWFIFMYDDMAMNEREAKLIRGHLRGHMKCANFQGLIDWLYFVSSTGQFWYE